MKIENIHEAPRKAVLAVLGIQESWFHKLKRAGVLQPIDGKAVYDLPDVVRSYLQFHQAGEGSDMATEKLKLVMAQRRQIEQRTEAEGRELVPVQEAQNAFTAAMALLAAQLDGLAGRMAGELAGIDDPAAVREALFIETRRIRDAAAKQLETFASDPGRRQPAEATTTEDA